MKNTIRTTKKGKQQEFFFIDWLCCEIYIATLNWPSLGITPDAPEYGIRTAAGPLAFSRDRDALVTWAKRNYIHTH